MDRRPLTVTMRDHPIGGVPKGIVSERLTAPDWSGPSRDSIKLKKLDSPTMRRAWEGRS